VKGLSPRGPGRPLGAELCSSSGSSRVQLLTSGVGRVSTEAVSACGWGLEYDMEGHGVAAQVTEGTLSVAVGVGGMEGSCLGKVEL